MVPSSITRALRLALAGSVLAAGGTAAIAAGRTTHARAAPAALDQSFGSHGTVALGHGYRVSGMAIQGDGKIVVVGDLKTGTSVQLMVARLTSSGKLDRSFNHGRVKLGPSVSTGGSIGSAVALQRDGKIVVTGVLTDRSAVAQEGMLVERLTAGGGLDNSFGRRGTATVLAGTAQSAASALAVQRDGKIVVAGSGPGSDGLPRAALARLTTRGSLDRGFGASGVVIAQGSQDLGRYGTVAALGLQSGGKIVIAGSARPNLQVTDAVVARFSSRGALDRSFGTSGRFVVPGAVKGGAAALFRSLAVNSAGIVAAGSATASGATPAYALVARLSSSGRPAGSFGSRGIVTLPAERGSTPPNPPPGANAVALARGGTIVLTGSYLDSGRSEVALWSLRARGSVLGSGSTRTILSSSLGSGVADAVALDRQGRITTFGTSNNFVAYNGFGLRYRGFGP